MPHFVVSISKPLPDGVDKDVVLNRLFTCASQSKLFEDKDIKIRVKSFDCFSVGGALLPFIHVEVRLLSGRSERMKKSLSESVLSVMKSLLRIKASLSVEIIDIDRASYSKCLL
jgi:5-carboxymethyl-2-hydroxymuconate isomerase